MRHVIGDYPYVVVVLLLAIGLYGMIGKRHLLRKVIGLNIFQTAVYLFFIHGAAKQGATVPVLDARGADPTAYVNPLPHVIVLTAIVVGVALTGVALALLVRIKMAFGSLDERKILSRLG